MATQGGALIERKRRRKLLLLVAGFAALLIFVNFQSLKLHHSKAQANHGRSLEEEDAVGTLGAGGLQAAEVQERPPVAEGNAAEVEEPATGGGSGGSTLGTPCTVAEMISEPAHVRGPVQKQGLLNLDHWHRNRAALRMERWTNWKSERKRRMELEVQQPGTGGSLPPPPVYPACHVFINHRYRFIYLRHPKAASTSLLAFFGKCVDGATPYNSSCIEPLFTQAIPPKELEPIWSSYTVFTFVRNPWDRAVSAYKMMMRYLEWEPVPPGEGGASTLAAEAAAAEGGQRAAAMVLTEDSSGEEMAEEGDSTGAGRQQQQQGAAGDGQQQQFRYKVAEARQYGWDNFCADPASFERLCRQDDKCKSRGRTFVPLHLLAQAPCVLAANGGWAVDFVGSVERIDEDLNSLLTLIEQRVAGEGLPALPRLEARLPNINGRRSKVVSKGDCTGANATAGPDGELSEPYCDREQYYSGRHSACLHHIRRYYESDAERLFGEERTGPTG